jgi:hypothetical protein
MNDELIKQIEKLVQAIRIEERGRLLVNLAAVVKAYFFSKGFGRNFTERVLNLKPPLF